jgi:OFA family oxalate/formate antiporter-like MFS transporter
MTNRWLPIVGGILMNLALGSLYGWSVFVLPLEREFKWTRAETSWVYTIAIVVFALSFIVAGRIQDMKGPKICALIGGVLVSADLLDELHQLAAVPDTTFGVIVGLGNGSATRRRYRSPRNGSRQAGLVVGLMVGGYGAGSAILGPLALRLIDGVGWRATFQTSAPSSCC